MARPAFAFAFAAFMCTLMIRSASASATYTPLGGALNSTDYAAWLAAQSAAGESLLVLAPGSYTVAAPAPSAAAHVVFPALSNVVLECSGVTLVMADRREGAAAISGWINTTLRGLAVRYASPPSNSALVTGVDTSNASAPALLVQVEAGMPLEDWAAGTVASCNAFDGATRLQKRATWDLYIASIAPVAAGTPAKRAAAAATTTDTASFRLTMGNVGQLTNVAVGDVLGCRIPNGRMTVTVEAENSTFEDISLYGGPCFGFLHSGGPEPGQRGGNTFRRVSILRPDPPPGAPAGQRPPLSTSADGLHVSGVPRGPTVVGAYFEGMNDDGIAIHGQYSLVTDAWATNGSVMIAAVWGAQMYAAGEPLAIVDASFAPAPPSSPPAFAHLLYTITSVAPAWKGYAPPKNVSRTMPSASLAPGTTTFLLVSLAPPAGVSGLPPGIGFDFAVANAGRVGDGFALINNTIVNHRARGMLIKAGGGVISGNTIANSSLGGIIITPELAWGEAHYTHGLLVANNSVTGVARALQGYGGIALGAVDPSGRLAAAPGHAGVTIANNTVSGAGYAPIWLSSAGGVTLTGNVVESPFPVPPSTPNGLPECCEPLPRLVAVYAESVANLTASGNCVRPAAAGEGSMGWVFNWTSVTGDFEGGVALCP